MYATKLIHYRPPGGLTTMLPPQAPSDLMQRHAEGCGCSRYWSYYNRNKREIDHRCEGRRPHDYRTDSNGCRWENGRPAQTQILDQTQTTSTIMAGNNKLTIDKADKSVRIQNADGSCQTLDLKLFEDPHVKYNGRDIGTLRNNLTIKLEDGTDVHFLMGDGKGGKPRPGAQTFVDSVATRSPDGTGALITGISGPDALKVTPLDSSHASQFLANETLGKFGHYESSHVFIDRRGNVIDSSNGQLVLDQNGLNRLDQEQQCEEAAHAMYRQGYVPRQYAQQVDRPYANYDQETRQQAIQQLTQMMSGGNRLQQMLDAINEKHAQMQMQMQMPVARYPMSSGFAYGGYGQAY